jgi:hypothetical protein
MACVLALLLCDVRAAPFVTTTLSDGDNAAVKAETSVVEHDFRDFRCNPLVKIPVKIDNNDDIMIFALCEGDDILSQAVQFCGEFALIRQHCSVCDLYSHPPFCDFMRARPCATRHICVFLRALLLPLHHTPHLSVHPRSCITLRDSATQRRYTSYKVRGRWRRAMPRRR